MNEQRYAIDKDWQRYDWKRRAAARFLGDQKARSVARPLSIARARLNSFTRVGRENNSRLRNFADIHRGKCCVIVGNGPSLRKTDMSLLRQEYTFGLNRIYMMFEELGFGTTYHVVMNPYVVEQWTRDFQMLDAPLFTAAAGRDILNRESNTYYLDTIIGPWFSRDVTRGVWTGHTVTYVAMQLAYYMGFSRVVLIGVDHRFAVSGVPNQLVDATGSDASHFDPRYFSEGSRWQLPDLASSEIAYRLAREAFEEDGREIVDSTVDGALTVFPKLQLEDALKRL